MGARAVRYLEQVAPVLHSTLSTPVELLRSMRATHYYTLLLAGCPTFRAQAKKIQKDRQRHRRSTGALRP